MVASPIPVDDTAQDLERVQVVHLVGRPGDNRRDLQAVMVLAGAFFGWVIAALAALVAVLVLLIG